MTTTQRTRSLQWLSPDRVETPTTLTADEAMAYLHDQIGDAALGLINRTGDLTEAVGYEHVALTLAAAVMREVGLTVQEYLSRFTSERPRQSDAVATACSIAIASADGRSPVDAARPLLSVMALLSPHGIAPEILESDAVAIHLRGLVHRELSTGDIHDVLLTLHRLGLARAHLAGPHRVVHVRDEVQRAVRNDLTSDVLRQLARVSADALDRTWPGQVADIDLDLVQALRSAHALDSHAGTHLVTPDAGCHSVLLKVGNSIGQAGLPTDAVAYFRELESRVAEIVGADHPDTLRIRGHAASWLGHTRNWQGAFTEFDSLRQDHRRVHGDDHPDTLAVRASRASYLARTGDVTNAIAELEIVLDARTRLLGSTHPDTLNTRARLASWRARSGRSAEAVDDLECILADYYRCQPGELRGIFRTRASLATSRGHAGDPATAAKDFRAILAEQLKTFGRDNFETLVTRKTLIHWYRASGDHHAASEARSELDVQSRAVLDNYEDFVNADHPDVLALRATVSMGTPPGTDRAADATELRQLLLDLERVVGSRHPDTVTARSELATVLHDSGDPAAAVAELRNVLEQAEAAFGPLHPQALKALARLASWLGKARAPGSAVRILQVLLDRQEKTLGPRHGYIRTTLSNLARQHSANKNQLAAGEALVALLMHQQRQPRAPEQQILKTQLQLAVWRAECGHVAKAVEDLRRIVDLHTASLGPWHPDTLAARFQAIRWRSKVGQGGANRALKGLLRDQLRHLGSRHRQVAQSRQLLKTLEARRAPARNRATLQNPFAQQGVLADTWDRPPGTIARLVRSSRAAVPLLEALALSSDEPLTRPVWLAMTNALSVTAPIDESDVDHLLADAEPEIISDADEDTTVYRISPALGRRMLMRAAGRTGLGELDTVLRHRRITHVLIEESTSGRLTFQDIARSLPRHAAAGACLRHLTRHPEILDHLDVEVLAEEATGTWLSGTPLPEEISDIVEVRHLLTGLSAGDRAAVRGAVIPQQHQRRETPTPVWTVAWTQQSSDPRHLTLISAPVCDEPHKEPATIRALASIRRAGTSLLIVGRSTGEIELWDLLRSHRLQSKIHGPANLQTLEIAVVDGVVVVSMVSDRHVWMWDLDDDSLWRDLTPEADDGIRAARFIAHRDRARVLALVAGSGHLMLWEPLSERVIDRSVARLKEPADTICRFPSRRRLGDCVAIACRHVTTWETDPLRLTDVTAAAGDGPVTSMTTVVHDGSTQLWVGGTDGTLAIHDPYTGHRTANGLIRAHDASVLALATLSRKGADNLVASAGADGTIALWDPRTARRKSSALVGCNSDVQALATHRLTDGRTLIASAGVDRSVRLWDPSRAAETPIPRNNSGREITAIAVAQLGEQGQLHLVTGHRDGSLRRHDPATGHRIGTAVQGHPSPVRMMTNLHQPPGGSRVVTVSDDNIVRVWDFHSTNPITTLPAITNATVQAIVAVERQHADALLAVGDSVGTIRLWDGFDVGHDVDAISSIDAHNGAIRSIASGNLDDGTACLVTGAVDRMIRFWNPYTADANRTPIKHEPGSINALTLIPGAQGTILAVSTDHGKIRLYSLAGEESLTDLDVGSCCGELIHMTSIRAESGDPLLLCVGRCGVLTIIRPDTLQQVHRLRIDGPIGASYQFDSHLVLSTRRGLRMFTLTCAASTRMDDQRSSE